MTIGTVDVVVVGGGPSGALAARELARAGASVLLLERSPVPRRKVCGACVGPAALTSLEAVGLGALPDRGGAIPLRELTVVGPGGISAALPLRGGVAWSRAAMDAALLDEARTAGAQVRTEVRGALGQGEASTRVVRLSGPGVLEATVAGPPRHQEGHAPNDASVRARLVLDASGLGGLRDRSGGPSRDRLAPAARVGLGAILADGRLRGRRTGPPDLSPGRVVMVVGRSGYVGLVRLEDGTVDVAAAVDPAALRGRTPEAAVAAVLVEAGLNLEGTPAWGWRGTPPLTRTPGHAAGYRFLRLGDALGYVEPFTGEGMGWALASARAVQPLARRALERWDDGVAAAWEAYRCGSAARAKRLCRAVAWSLRRPKLVWTALMALRVAPALAAPFLAAVERVPTAPRPGGRVSRVSRVEMVGP